MTCQRGWVTATPANTSLLFLGAPLRPVAERPAGSVHPQCQRGPVSTVATSVEMTLFAGLTAQRWIELCELRVSAADEMVTFELFPRPRMQLAASSNLDSFSNLDSRRRAASSVGEAQACGQRHRRGAHFRL